MRWPRRSAPFHSAAARAQAGARCGLIRRRSDSRGDPQQIADLYSTRVANAIFEGLYQFDYLATPARVVPNTAAAMPDVIDGDRHALRLTLAAADYTILERLAELCTYAVAREAVESAGEDVVSKPVGTGPFRLREWKRGSKVSLDANPDYRALTFPGSDDPALQQPWLLGYYPSPFDFTWKYMDIDLSRRKAAGR